MRGSSQRCDDPVRALKVFAGLLACALASSIAPLEAATVKGVVTVNPPPEPTPARILVDGHVCGHKDVVHERLIEADVSGRVRGVVLHVEPIAPMPRKKASPGKPLIIDQINCSFVPRIAAITLGTEVRFKNSDPVLHNVHAVKPGKGSLANFSLPLRGQEVSAFTAKEAGDVQLRCDAGHDWMKADIRVFDHPFFTQSAADGSYSIGDLEPGKYKLVAWHPDLGTREFPLEIAEKGDELSIQVSF